MTRGPGPTRPGRYLLASSGTLALTVLAVALLGPRLLGELAPPDLGEVAVHPDLRTDHVDGEIGYDLSPPAGGPHADAWLDCGVYDSPVPEENAVHALEHGTVWITYDPGLGADDLALLAEALPAEGILSPYPGLPGPVVVTVWGHQLVLDDAEDPRLGLFLAEYGDGHTAPEPFASCEGGVDETGATSATA